MDRIKKLLNTKKIAMITCYDATFASFLEKNQCDVILVGDSLGMTIKGQKNTHDVSMDEIIYHTTCVRRGAQKKPIISDMPIHSYQSKKEALKNAKSILNAGADIVKIEGDEDVYEIITHLVKNHIRVCGHIGYTPQKIKHFKKNKHEFLAKAKSLEVCGISMLVLSKTGAEIDRLITENINIPTISFRSSGECNGEVEILYDLLGLSNNLKSAYDRTIRKDSMTLKNPINNFIKKIKR